MKTSVLAIVILIALALIGIGVYYYMQNQPAPTTPGEQATAATNSVTIKGFKYTPTTLTIKAGGTVTWTNEDSAAHTVTSDSGEELNSDLLSKGQTYSHTFNTAGVYDYHCVPHPSMKARIVVQ